MKKRIVLASAALAMVATAASAQAPSGAELQVNSYTTGAQYKAAVASDGSGNFVVVWTSSGQDGDLYGIRGQRYNASGVPQASEFQVNSYTTNTQFAPAVASDPNGNFVVVWTSIGQDGSNYGVFGRRFNAAGVAQGDDFQVNTYTTGYQYALSAASAANGNFVVIWQSFGQDGSGYGVFGQRFNASGARLGSEFRVNSYTTGYQGGASVTSTATGNFVVVWESYQDGSSEGVLGQRYDSAGAAQGSEFQINSYTTGFQYGPAVASDANGNFTVAWASQGQDGSTVGVFGQRFNAAGLPQGSEFQVNSYTTDYQGSPSVASDANGNFVVVWESYGQDGSGYGVFGQRFNAAGAAQGSEFRVNSYTTGYQRRAAVASGSDGDFIVVWDSVGQDGSGLGVFGQRYGDLIFEDGFESGDLTRWSAAATDGGDLSVGGAGAMGGTTSGLIAFVNDTNSLFVQDDTPNSENRYRARFYFDTNGFDPGEAQSHLRTRIFIAFDNSPVRVITLVLRRQLGAYSVEGRVRRNDGTRADTGFFPITDGPHFFEVDWLRATGPGAMNGSFTLRIDGGIVSTLGTLDNDASPVDFVRMGALAVKTGASGTLFYDQFESRRVNLIGPE